MSNIHPTAIVAATAQIDETAIVEAYAHVGPNVKIGAGTIIQEHAYVDGHTTIGKDCKIFPFACVGMQTQDLKYDGGITYLEIGDRNTLREFSTFHLGTKDGEKTIIGNDNLIMAYCHVAHGCRLGNHIIMSNSVQLAGEVQVDDYAIIGGMSGVHQFTRVGTHAMIGGASLIKQDAPPYMITEGRDTIAVRGPNVVGLQRRGFTQEVRSALKEAYRILYRDGLNRTQALERISYEVVELPEVATLCEFYRTSKRGVC